MNRESLKRQWEIIEGEGLKTTAEFALHSLAKHRWGDFVIAAARGGERVESPRLHTNIAGVEYEGPVMAGAGWDKKGWAVDGLYKLGFAGTEVGAVLLFGQYGNPKPRLFIDKQTKSVGLNRLGFNAPGVDVVQRNLEAQKRLGVVGINIGVNKLLLEQFPDKVPQAMALVAEYLYDYADYFVINPSSPNTPGLHGQLKPAPLRENIRAVKRSLREKGGKPLYVKLTVDMADSDLDQGLEVCVDEGVDGVIDSNTTINDIIKAKYGWAGQMGGLSGNDPGFRYRATERMKYITRSTRGTGLQRKGVGGIHNAATAIERIEAGAQCVQVVTGIRQHKGKVARDINIGILKYLDKVGAKNVDEIVGIAA